MITISLVISCAIFFGIAIRQWLPDQVRIWHIMTAGAVILLLLGEISPAAAVRAVDWNVIAYLFGVFAIASALYDCGISHAIGARIVGTERPGRSFLVFILATALCAAVLTNDAAAVIGTPIALMLARALGWRPSVVLIALCASVTAGSMVSPVGNPQNILIATAGNFTNSIGTFALWLAAPTLASLAFVFVWLRRGLGKAESGTEPEFAELPAPYSQARAWPAYVGTGVLVVLIGADSLLDSIGIVVAIPFGVASLIACSPIFAFSNRRIQTFKEVDWSTLVFFVSMFIVTGSLLQSGSLQAMLGSLQSRLSEPPVTALISFWASQLFSNVPVVDIYLKLLGDGEVANLMMLAGISTLAGNLFIISAASNVIVVQQAEKFGQTPFNFWQFSIAVLPITVVSVALTYGWVIWMAGLR
jgi:Na+/H+ antiporter NhaD/arsenite permease-like protein